MSSEAVGILPNFSKLVFCPRNSPKELQHLVDGDRTGLLPPRQPPSAPVHVAISPGELLDKISILEIKQDRISDAAKLENVRRELAGLQAACAKDIGTSPELLALTGQLKAVNQRLWEIEDEIRLCEAQDDFGPRFVELARSVYAENDRRSTLKRQINDLLGSPLVEEKDYRARP